MHISRFVSNTKKYIGTHTKSVCILNGVLEQAEQNGGGVVEEDTGVIVEVVSIRPRYTEKFQ